MYFLIVLLMMAGAAFLYLLFLLRKLPWQKPKFDIYPLDIPVLQGENAVLIFSKTNGFRHRSIEFAIESISREGEKRGWQVVATENGAAFHTDYLKAFKVVVFLSTTGNILTMEQQLAFQQYIENGGGYAGIHSAADTEHAWEWYNRFLGTHFKSHPLIPGNIGYAELITENRNHPATRHLPENWHKKDEWYNFKTNVRSLKNVQVLLSLNENSYVSIYPKKMDGDHPVSWTNVAGQGRMFYTGMGHTKDSFKNEMVMQHILGGIEWAGKL